MAGTQRIIEQYIARERKNGKSDNAILVGLTKQKGQVGKDVNKFIRIAREQGATPSRALADYFGLDLTPVDVSKHADRKVNEWQSRGESALAGVADAGAGIVQGMYWVKDKAASKANDVFGTDFETDSLADYNKDYQHMNKHIDAGRRGSGRGKGTDWLRVGSEVLTTASAFAMGGGAGEGVKGLAALAGRQGTIGAGVGAARHADSAAERKSNITWGGAGGAVGGVVGEKIVAPAVRVVGRNGMRTVAKVRGQPAHQTAHIRQTAKQAVDDALASTGIKLDSALKANVTRDVEAALAQGKQLDAAALARKNLLEKHNIKGTQAQITRDPMLWATEREAAKHKGAEALNNVHIENHQQLNELMQKLIDDTGTAPINTHVRMKSTFNALKQSDDLARDRIGAMYDDAVSELGADVPIRKDELVDSIGLFLNREGENAHLDRVLHMIKGSLDEDGNLTLKAVEGLKKRLNRTIGTTTDGNQRWVLGQVKKLIDEEVDASVAMMRRYADEEPMAGSMADNLTLAKQKYSDARQAYANRAKDIENTPALKAAIDGVEPDKAFNKYVLNANAADIVRMVDMLKKTPTGQQNIADLQGATIEHFLEQATKANNGGFSPSGLNRAIESFGENRMKALFTTEQMARLNDIRQVADILVQQPLGAHVNHSNTANVLIRQLVGIANTAGKMPMLGNVALGAVGAVGGLAKSGAAAKMVQGTVPVTAKGGSMGLSPEQLKRLGLWADGGRAITAAAASQ